MAQTHTNTPDCWCKPVVIERGSTRTITHKDVQPKRETK